jgi:hypothetical protein
MIVAEEQPLPGEIASGELPPVKAGLPVNNQPASGKNVILNVIIFAREKSSFQGIIAPPLRQPSLQRGQRRIAMLR